MIRYSAPDLDELVWVDVTPYEPCPVCGAVSECRRLESGEFVHCLQTVSEWPMLGLGWVHRVTGAREISTLTLV